MPVQNSECRTNRERAGADNYEAETRDVPVRKMCHLVEQNGDERSDHPSGAGTFPKEAGADGEDLNAGDIQRSREHVEIGKPSDLWRRELPKEGIPPIRFTTHLNGPDISQRKYIDELSVCPNWPPVTRSKMVWMLHILRCSGTHQCHAGYSVKFPQFTTRTRSAAPFDKAVLNLSPKYTTRTNNREAHRAHGSLHVKTTRQRYAETTQAK